MAQLQMLRDQATGNPVMANPYPEVKGSQYWTEFDSGTIIFSDKDTLSDVVIAFNAFNHTLEYRQGRELMAYSPGKINGFILNPSSNPQLYRSGYDIPGTGKNRFVEVLVDGDYTLVNHKYKKMIDDPGATYGSQRAKAFSNAEDLYVFKDGEAFLWKTRKKIMVEYFGDEVYKTINELSNKYNLDLKEKADIRRLIMLLNADK
ncbi:hypothetical protein [Arthrospiribacter ruber]|nr:hypothetical protein [Arthrospiribacter ruber]